MAMFHLLKIRTSTDIFKNEKCKVTFGLEYSKYTHTTAYGVGVHNSKRLLRHRVANQSLILCKASMGRGCSRHMGHMTKMAVTPIYGKTH